MQKGEHQRCSSYKQPMSCGLLGSNNLMFMLLLVGIFDLAEFH